MADDKKHIDIDLDFLDKTSSPQEEEGGKSQKETPHNRSGKKLSDYNWKKILIIGGVILFFGWVIFLDDTSTPTRPYNSLPNGTVLQSSLTYLTGPGELEIDNGTNDDALIKLVTVYTNTPVYTVYIKANSEYKILDISDGIYKLLYMQGKDWDGINQTFLVNKNSSRFRENLTFTTTAYDSTIYGVTLHSVSGGTAETDNISEDEFDKY